ncbi:MAG TPA: hypothetical protein VFE62_26785 [Gemmataceae bacterium]|nr:hypothetical protein [Gemmataceae bacterium]
MNGRIGLAVCAVSAALFASPILAPPHMITINRDRYRDQEIARDVGAFMSEHDCEELHRTNKRWKKEPAEVRWKIVQLLRRSLGSNKEFELHNYADLFVESRLKDGGMRFHGHGLWFTQDAFLENGRGAWMIEELLQIRLPDFTDELNADQLKAAVREANGQINLWAPR